MSQVRVPLFFAQSANEGYSNVRVNYVFSQDITEGENVPNVRLTYQFGQDLTEGNEPPTMRLTLMMLETLSQVGPEEVMSTNPFPGFGNSIANPAIPAAADPFSTPLPGLAFSVHKKPQFKTKVAEATSGFEIRNAMAQYPRWDIELTYEFLEDKTGAQSSLKTIMGFFLARQGSFDSFLFKDPDDYLVTLGELGVGDAVTTQFGFVRRMGEFDELVGQVDNVNSIVVYAETSETHAVPGMAAYTIVVDFPALGIVDMGVIYLGTPMTKVTGAPGALEYAVNEATGVYTFNAARAGNSVTISYRHVIPGADYTVTMPNLLVFDSAPAAGDIIVATFQFYFACRFTDDQVDFEKFYDKLWNLQECNFRSIIQ